MQKVVEMGQSKATAALPIELHPKIRRIRKTIIPCQCYNLCRRKEPWKLMCKIKLGSKKNRNRCLCFSITILRFTSLK
jgi:hypothetical protein